MKARPTKASLDLSYPSSDAEPGNQVGNANVNFKNYDSFPQRASKIRDGILLQCSLPSNIPNTLFTFFPADL